MQVVRSVLVPVVATGASHWRDKRRPRETTARPERPRPPQAPADGGPRVSVLVPCWNFKPYIAACLESIVSQSYGNIEIVITDDLTSDGSFEIAQQYAERDGRIRLYRNETNLGDFRNSLRLMELAESEILMIVGSDDVLDRDCVATLVEAMQSAPGVAIGFGHFDLIDESGELLDDRLSVIDRWPDGIPVPGVDFGDGMLRRCRNLIGSPTAVAFRSAALIDKSRLPLNDRLPGASPNRQPNSDVLWWTRILSRGDAVYVRRTLSHRREHQRSTTHSSGALARLVDSWYQLLIHAQQLGFLEHPEAAREAWASYVILAGAALRRPQILRDARQSAPVLMQDIAGACRKLDEIGRRQRLSASSRGSAVPRSS